MGLDKKLSMGTTAKASIFYKLIYKPPYCNFLESRKKVLKNIYFLFYPLLFVSLQKICFRICLCNFESDTVKSDCPIHIFRKNMKYLKI